MEAATWALVAVTAIVMGAQVVVARTLLAVTRMYVSETQKLAASSARAAEATKASAEAARDSVEAMEAQVGLQREQLSYYYQPGVALQVHAMPGVADIVVKAYAASQTPVFRVRVGWSIQDAGPAQDIRITSTECGEALRAVEGDLGNRASSPRWTAARLMPRDVGWCLLTAEAVGAELLVRWGHVTEAGWVQRWELAQLPGTSQRALLPKGPPVRDNRPPASP